MSVRSTRGAQLHTGRNGQKIYNCNVGSAPSQGTVDCVTTFTLNMRRKAAQWSKISKEYCQVLWSGSS